MALADQLKNLDRASERSVTQQLVDAFTAAIASGELAPGEQLPPTRELARIAGVNQLTASRCYRRLSDEALVISGVGRGTFVRDSAAVAAADRFDSSWQTYALPAARESYAGRIVGELGRHAVNRDLIALSVGYPATTLIPRADLDAAVAEALAAGGAANYEYGPVEGTDELRAQLAALGRTRGLDDGADDILVTTGGRQALTLAARAVLRPGDVVACESPTFMGVIEAVRATGAEVLPIAVDAGGFSVDALEQVLRSHQVRLVALQPRMQNPTGRDLAPDRRTRLIELASRHGFFVLEDAVYADLRYEGADPGPLRALDPAHVIYVDSLSKTVGPGLRAGWVAASGEVLDRIIAEKRSDDAHSATLPQQVAARYLAAGHLPDLLEEARTTYRVRRDALAHALRTQMGDLATFTNPQGGGHIWATLLHACDDEQLYRAALDAGVSYVPGPAMLVGRPDQTYLRLSFTTVTPAELREGVERLAATVRAVTGVHRRRHTLPMS
jgi:2-aminoadipate transaminase